MERLFDIFAKRLAQTDTSFVRSQMNEIEWKARMIGIRGARGVGKTTLLLQHIKLHRNLDSTVLYTSLDNIWFSDHRLYDLASDFVKRGGQFLYLDEVHKYPNWAQELKNIYDDFAELQVIFTGSSLLEILNARADLSRRAVVYEMQGFSFREYLNRNLGLSLPSFKLQELLENHIEIAHRIVSEVRVLAHFDDYLQHGYYPFYNELPSLYRSRVNEVVNLIIDIEFPQLRGVDPAYLPKIKQLLYIVAEASPFIPNITKLGERIGLTRNALLAYLSALHESRLTFSAQKAAFGITRLQKPDKLYLENTNLMYMLAENTPNSGNVRETFFANQLRRDHRVNVSEKSDFMVDGHYTFEIGGKEKGKKQIDNIPDSYIAADNVEHGFVNKIPLWLFGFLY
ncbi:MAG: AAA family ATPase [Prevotella sp.]|nr:AAA family ATPase [Prevotella sp.]